jgi:hypothetical protein
MAILAMCSTGILPVSLLLLLLLLLLSPYE